MRLNRSFIGVVSCVLLCSVASEAEAVQYFDAPSTIDNNSEWTNYLRLADLDGDSDLDLIVPNCAGFFNNPGAQNLRVYFNDGGTFTEVTAAALGGAQNLATRVVAVGDINGDGANDIFAPSAAGAADILWVNNGSGTFTNEAATRLPGGGTSSRSAGARFGDVDGDGDLDLLVTLGYNTGDTPVAALYINDGVGNFTASTSIPMSGVGTDPDDVDFLDFDRDFDLDVLITTHGGSSILWRNDDGAFVDVSSQLAPPDGGPFKYGPSVCDVDGDGDLDIFVDNVGPGGKGEQLLINDGMGNFADETAQRVTGNPNGADDNGVMCVDVDDDGDFDAIVTALGPGERVLINDGMGNFTHNTMDPGFPTNSGDCSLWADYGDLDGDGRLEAVTGQGECSGSNVNKVYPGSASQPVDTTPPVITAVETVDVPDAGQDLVIRYAVSDRYVSDSGPRLSSAYANVSVDGGAATAAEATFMGGDLFRVVIPSEADGAMVSVELCAEDRQGNVGCSQPLGYVVGDPSSGVGGGGAGGSGGVGGAGTGGSGATSGAGGSGDGFSVDEDDGCGCTVPGGDSRTGALALLGLGLGIAVMRRRRR